MKMKFALRPVCSCGAKMKLIKYEGYYDSFNYWRCDNCDLANKIQNVEADKGERGAYA